MTSRYFIGIKPLGLETNEQLVRVFSKIKKTLNQWDEPVRFSSPALWHVTILFLGELSIAEADKVQRLLEQWHPPAKTHLEFAGLGAFPSEEEARVIWVGVRKSQALIDLQASFERLLLEHGLYHASKTQSFVPHVTLARLRNSRNVKEITSLGRRTRFGKLMIEEVTLFESVLQGQMPKYVPKFSRPLSGNS